MLRITGKEPCINLAGRNLASTESEKLLGLVLNSNMSW